MKVILAWVFLEFEVSIGIYKCTVTQNVTLILHVQIGANFIYKQQSSKNKLIKMIKWLRLDVDITSPNVSEITAIYLNLIRVR